LTGVNKVILGAILLALATVSCHRGTLPTPQSQTAPTPTQTPREILPKQFGPINDYAKVFDQSAQTRLLFTINELRTNSDVQFVVATVDSTNGQSIFDYSLALAREWRPGGESGRGLLLVLAIRDRQWHLQVSKALEKDLPDQVCKELGTRSEQLYKQGKYADGVDLYVRAIGDKLKAKK
jgi:uncharacterized protein